MNPQRPTWLEINLDAIANNIRQLRSHLKPACILMSVVKANAYGHGAIDVARTAISAGADRLAVATLTEAIELRNAAIDVPLLVLGYTSPEMASLAVQQAITLTIYDMDLAKALNDAAHECSQQPNLPSLALAHVKINTGMNRLGLPVGKCAVFLRQLAELQNLEVEGIYTHFATADEEDKSFAIQQFDRFQKLLTSLSRQNLRPPIAHAANSAATLTLPQTHLDMVRPGIATYGLHPDPMSNRLPDGFQPAMTWKALIAHINQLEIGDSVSYGREFKAEQPTTIAVLPIGYADGFPRKPLHWKYVLIDGQPAPIVGRVCMDQTMVDISTQVSTNKVQVNGSNSHPKTKQGDEAILIGRQGDADLTAEDIAEQLGTNNYDVVSRILSRVPRIYIKKTSYKNKKSL